MALSILGAGGCGTRTSCYIQLLQDFNRSQMFHKNLRLTSSPFPANKGGLYDDLKVCHQKVVVGIDSVPGLLPIAHGLLRRPRGTVLSGHLWWWELLGYFGSPSWGKSGKRFGQNIFIYIYINNQQWTSCWSFIQITSGVYSISSQ